MAKGSGFGKVILFNEHFVVYGVPAIVSAIDMETTAIVESSRQGLIINDERRETPRYKMKKLEQQKDSLKRMMKAMAIDISKNPIKITLKGDLIAASGIGASAASCAAIARALSSHFNLDLSDEEINEIAYEGEKGYHGTPSGIDNTAATFGGVIWFEKGEQNKIEKINIKPIEIVMGNTGIVANTKEAVAGVRKRRGENPEKYDKIFNNARDLVYNARDSLVAGDLEKVGQYMDENHDLLKQIGVSNKELDFLVEIARREEALGAKLTGGGLGGYMVALTPGKELQERVATTIEKEGFQALRTRIGG
jgi:mevalonate kinase